MNSREAASGLGLGVAGLFLQTGGYYVQGSHGLILLGALMYVLGTGLLLAGLTSFAKAKGRSPAWGVLAVFSILGLIVLVVLKDKISGHDPVPPEEEGEKLVERAAQLDFAGQWDEAVTLFESVLIEPRYQEHHLYARNCIQRIREKQSFAQQDG